MSIQEEADLEPYSAPERMGLDDQHATAFYVNLISVNSPSVRPEVKVSLCNQVMQDLPTDLSTEEIKTIINGVDIISRAFMPRKIAEKQHKLEKASFKVKERVLSWLGHVSIARNMVDENSQKPDYVTTESTVKVLNELGGKNSRRSARHLAQRLKELRQPKNDKTESRQTTW
jgi:hypothetical protein